MSENNNTILPPNVEDQIQSRWLGLVQTEMGVLQTNLFNMQARLEALMLERAVHLNTIDNLKLRVTRAEEDLQKLQQQWHEKVKECDQLKTRKSSKAANRKEASNESD
jgi:chromosome segregation ATPase